MRCLLTENWRHLTFPPHPPTLSFHTWSLSCLTKTMTKTKDKIQKTKDTWEVFPNNLVFLALEVYDLGLKENIECGQVELTSWGGSNYNSLRKYIEWTQLVRWWGSNWNSIKKYIECAQLVIWDLVRVKLKLTKKVQPSLWRENKECGPNWRSGSWGGSNYDPVRKYIEWTQLVRRWGSNYDPLTVVCSERRVRLCIPMASSHWGKVSKKAMMTLGMKLMRKMFEDGECLDALKLQSTNWRWKGKQQLALHAQIVHLGAFLFSRFHL